MSIRLSAAWILAFDGEDHVLLHDSSIVIERGAIVHVGPDWHGRVEAERDYGGCLLAPGFIDLNALGDIDTTILSFAVPATTGPGLLWSMNYAARARDVLSQEEQVFGASFALAQCLRNGITTALPVTSLLARGWAEDTDEFAAIAEAGIALGMRLYLGPSFRSAVSTTSADGEITQLVDEARGWQGLTDALAFIRRWDGRGNGLIHGLLVPSTIETCSADLLERTASAAREFGLPFRLHCCQSIREAKLIAAASEGRTSIGHLAHRGVLGPQALLPHAVILGGPSEDPVLANADRQRLADTGSVAVHCPLVIGRSGRALDSFGSFLEHGVRMGLGTDTTPPDMLMNMQIGLISARLAGPRAEPEDYMRVATLGGASALGRADLGRIAAGALADIVAFDLEDPACCPVHDPVQALFLGPTGKRVRDVWIAGRLVVEGGRVLGFDEAAAAPRIQQLFNRLRAAYSERDVRQRSWPDLFPPSFPIRAQTTAPAKPRSGRKA
jgi:cytosine/adenosine deaminase-related metal-dependent hydrolase